MLVEIEMTPGPSAAFKGRARVAAKSRSTACFECTKLSRTPTEIARGMFYDSNVYDADYLRHLIRHTAPGHMFLGTDYPFALMQTEPFAYLGRSELGEADLEGVCVGAATAFLGL